MIDYFKILLFNDQFRKPILQNPLLSFETRVKDGVIISQNTSYKNIKVWVGDRETIISGSLHKFWNPNGSNSNDFPMGGLRMAIIDLSYLFGFSPADAIILGLEYGVNVIADASVSELISRAVCYDCREPFESMKGIRGAGNGKDAELANYRIKIYDKGLQYGLPEPLLRFECKTKRSIDLKDTGAHTLWDLTNSEVLQRLGQKLISRFESILSHEKPDETLMSPKEQLLYHDTANPYFWQALKRWKRNDVKRQYAKLLEKYGGGILKSNLKKRVADKWEELQKCNGFAWSPENMSEKKGNVLTWFNEANSEQKGNVFPQLNESELTTAQWENCNDFAQLKAENVTSCSVSAEENPVQEPVGKSAIAEAEPSGSDLIETVPDGRRRQTRNCQLQIDWTGPNRTTGSGRPTAEVQTQETIPPAEEVSVCRRRRRENREDLAKADRSECTVSNQISTQNKKFTEWDEYPQGKENVIRLYLADEVEEEEIETNEVLSADRRMSTVKNYKNNPSSALVLLLKKANQEKRRRYRSAGKIYNDFKLKKLLSGRQVK